MATLSRSRSEYQAPLAALSSLNTSIPTPFPSRVERARLLQDELLDELANERVEFATHENVQAGPSRIAGSPTEGLMGYVSVYVCCTSIGRD